LATNAVSRTLGCVALLLLSLAAGCASRRTGAPPSDETTRPKSKIRAEAYLFDAKLRRDGKVNSFRLELFHTDTVLGLGGRGYLGKGVLKGRLTPDSLMVLFPTTNEYVHSSVSDLLSTTECAVPVPPLSLISFFRTLPDFAVLDSVITVAGNYSDEDRPSFIIFVAGCPWQLELTYDRRSEGWRIRDFDFSDGGGQRLYGKRREYRSDVGVKLEKFMVDIPDDAVRIIP